MIDEQLIRELESQRDLMVAVATGGPRIDSVNQDYIARRSRIAAGLRERGIPEDPVPFEDLWAWRGRWSSGDYPTYQSRRDYLASLFAPLIKRLREGKGASIVEEPTGWARVDRLLEKAAADLDAAEHGEHFKSVGLYCREALIAVAQEVYVPARHPSLDGVSPSPTDAKRMLDAFFSVELAGNSHLPEAARKHARAALDLAHALTHKETADYREGLLTAEATRAVLNLLAIITGRRDRRGSAGLGPDQTPVLQARKTLTKTRSQLSTLLAEPRHQLGFIAVTNRAADSAPVATAPRPALLGLDHVLLVLGQVRRRGRHDEARTLAAAVRQGMAVLVGEGDHLLRVVVDRVRPVAPELDGGPAPVEVRVEEALLQWIRLRTARVVPDLYPVGLDEPPQLAVKLASIHAPGRYQRPRSSMPR